MKNICLTLCLLFSLPAMRAQTLTEKDRVFALDAAHNSLFEMKLAELTITNADTLVVKDLGQKMVANHTKAYNELKALALSKNFEVPSELNTESQNKLNALSKVYGSDFDQAYSSMMVKDQEAAITKFKNESKTGSDKEIRTWASVTLPILEHELMMSKDAEAAVNSKKKSR